MEGYGLSKEASEWGLGLEGREAAGGGGGGACVALCHAVLMNEPS